jgi:hypothetical protein
MEGGLRRKENAFFKFSKIDKQYCNAFMLFYCPRGSVERVATMGMVLTNNE